MDIIVRGNEYRTMSPTEANATSSRSHAVLQINVSSKDRNASVNEPHTMATLSIIDLAGSERASVTKNRGERLLEGANINKSLLALGSCINALCDPRKRNHIPYRNSKLTRLLKFSLGGNCRTVMIVCVSPSSAHFDETQNTLRYANRAKNIQTKVTKNVFNVNRHVKDYLKKIDEQRLLIDELMKKQKDFEGSAFVKFQKQNEKKDGILHEGMNRLHQAYVDSADERKVKLQLVKGLKSAERRGMLIQSWIAAFDNVCESREEEEAPAALAAMRKEAVGISFELEHSRQHYHRQIEKNYWTTKLDTALAIGTRQLKEIDGSAETYHMDHLAQQYEHLKLKGDNDATWALLDHERGADAAVVQALVQAHLETVTILHQITQMDEEQAVQAARRILAKVMNSCTNATSLAIRQDRGPSVPEYFAPTTKGTPKRKKPIHIKDPSPMKPISLPATAPAMPSVVAPAMAPAMASVVDMPHLTSSPIKGSPRRRKMGPAKKGVQFTPKKKSPSKVKRGVRWRDDTENGTLAEFQKTPEQFESTPTNSSMDIPPPVLSSMIPAPEHTGSSPIPTPPKPSMDLKSRPSRFQAGFLSKKTDGSPPPPNMNGFSSDSERSLLSPLREIGTNAVRKSSLSVTENSNSSDYTLAEGGASSGSEEEKWTSSDARKIGHAIKRRSSTNQGSVTAVSRAHRRRSPTAATSCSPTNENSLSVGAARRMGKKEGEGWQTSVLSPRTAPVIKGAARRTTLSMSSDDRPKESSTLKRDPVRLTSGSRGSLMPGTKSVWR